MRGLRWAITLILAVAVAGPTWALPNGRPGATADERQLGALAAEQIIRQHGLLHDDTLQSRIDTIGHTLTKFVPGGEDYRFRILRSDDVNALTTPDGEDYIAIRHMAYFALSFGHRIIDGADAEKFLAHVKEQLEGGQFAI